MIRTDALDSEQVKRKPHLEQNRLHPDSRDRRFQRTLPVLYLNPVPKNYRASSKQTNKKKQCQLYLNR